MLILLIVKWRGDTFGTWRALILPMPNEKYLMPSLYSRSRVVVETFGEMWMRQGRRECRHSHYFAKTTRQSWVILISFDSGLIYQHVNESFTMRQEQTKSVEDETNVPFTLSFSSCLVLSRRECKPGINCISTGHHGDTLTVFYFCIRFPIITIQ